MNKGSLYYANGSIRFVGRYEPQEDGTEKYIEGKLYRKNGILWMEGTFQKGSLLEGKEYYPNGKLMFEGKYTDGKPCNYYGPPYPLFGKLYDKEGNIIYDGTIPRTSEGSLGYPYIRMPDGSTMAVIGVPSHVD